MSSRLAGLKIAVLGGDDREKVIVKELAKLDILVQTLGIPVEEQLGIKNCKNILEAVQGVDAVVLPMPGTDQFGIVSSVYASEPIVLNEEVFKVLPSKTPILVGVAKPYLKEITTRYQCRLIELAELDEIAIYNSIPSSEGAIQLAMAETDITIHGSNSLVIGFGRCGVTLTKMLKGIGANTYVTARKPKDLARIYEQGYNPISYNELKEFLPKMDIIFNTVPQLILTRPLIKQCHAETVIVDIASAPGGVDFASCKEMGLKAILAPGLPGKVAPKTAGLILAKAIPELLLKCLKGN
jgi:dipicolinate synthase subunit A